MQNLLMAGITANAVLWGIPAGEITTGTALQLLWIPGYSAVIDPATKTKATVNTKNAIRKKYELWMRPFVQRYLMLNTALDDGERIAMGLRPRETGRSVIPPPETTVQLDLVAGHGNTVKVIFRQEADGDGNTRRGKPDGVNNCEFAYKVDAPAPVSPDDCVVGKIASRSPLVISFEPEQAGKRLYVFARWLNAKDEAGPWTPVPASIIIPG